jgi:hypothetical protein
LVKKQKYPEKREIERIYPKAPAPERFFSAIFVDANREKHLTKELKSGIITIRTGKNYPSLCRQKIG